MFFGRCLQAQNIANQGDSCLVKLSPGPFLKENAHQEAVLASGKTRQWCDEPAGVSGMIYYWEDIHEYRVGTGNRFHKKKYLG